MSIVANSTSTIGRFIQDVGQAGRRLVSTDEAALERYDSVFADRLAVQLESARRHNRRFSVTIIPLEPLGRDERIDVLRRCTSAIRLLDAATLLEGELLVLWSDADRPQAADAAHRLACEGIVSEFAVPRHATFPDDGLTTEALIEAAEQRRLRPRGGERRERVAARRRTDHRPSHPAPSEMRVSAGR